MDKEEVKKYVDQSHVKISALILKESKQNIERYKNIVDIILYGTGEIGKQEGFPLIPNESFISNSHIMEEEKKCCEENKECCKEEKKEECCTSEEKAEGCCETSE